MEKEITINDEEIRALLSENKILLEAKSKGQEKDSCSPETDYLKKIVGNYHPGPESKTYREVLDENSSLKNAANVQKSQAEKFRSESESKDKEINRLKSELSRRASIQQHSPAPSPAPVQKQQPKPEKKPFALFRKKEPEKKPELSTEEKKKILVTLLIQEQRFSDEQVIFLSKVIRKSSLSPEGMLQLFNFQLNEKKMHQLYTLLCAEEHIVEDLDADDEVNGTDSNDDSSNNKCNDSGALEKEPIAIDVNPSDGGNSLQRLRRVADETAKARRR